MRIIHNFGIFPFVVKLDKVSLWSKSNTYFFLVLIQIYPIISEFCRFLQIIKSLMVNRWLLKPIMTAPILESSNHNQLITLHKLDPPMTSPFPLICRLMRIELRDVNFLINFTGVGLEGIHQWHLDDGQIHNLVLQWHVVVIVSEVGFSLGEGIGHLF